MRPVENWYFDLPAFGDFLRGEWRDRGRPEVRAIVAQAIKEFLAPPVVYIKNDAREAYEAVAGRPACARAARAREGQAELRDRVRGHRRPRCGARGARAGGHPLPHGQGARAVPHHGQHRMGREGPGHRRSRRSHRVVLAREPVGAHVVHHGRQRQDGPAAGQLARFLVLGGCRGVPVHRPGQPVLLRGCPAGAHRGAAPGRHHRARHHRASASARRRSWRTTTSCSATRRRRRRVR